MPIRSLYLKILKLAFGAMLVLQASSDIFAMEKNGKRKAEEMEQPDQVRFESPEEKIQKLGEQQDGETTQAFNFWPSNLNDLDFNPPAENPTNLTTITSTMPVQLASMTYAAENQPPVTIEEIKESTQSYAITSTSGYANKPRSAARYYKWQSRNY
jgi:hypothetical protein